MSILRPLFRKELIEVARRRRYYAARVLVGLALLVGLWLGIDPIEHELSTAQSAGIGLHFFLTWSTGVVVGLCTLVPPTTSALIAGEKDAGTLETLLTTPLSDREILLGKVASRFLLAVILVLSSLPAVADEPRSGSGRIMRWGQLMALARRTT